MVELWLTRHGETEYNVQGVVQGVVNSNLTARGAADAQALGRGFAKAGVSFDAAYSSDLQRAADTAQLALAAADMNQLSGLREQNFGLFDGQPETQRQGALGKMLKDAGVEHVDSLNMKQMVNLVRIIDVHNGGGAAENASMSIMRFGATMAKIAQDAEIRNQENVFVVAHGAIIWLWLNSLGMPDTADFIKNAAVSKVVYGKKGFTLLDYNSRKYVELGGGNKNEPTQSFNLD